MPGMNLFEPIPKRDMHVFYVLDTSSEERDSHDLRNVLLYMRWEFGLEVFRNPARMASIIKDLSSERRRDANILRHLGDAGLLAELEQADSRDWARVIAKTRYWLENELFMREEQAAYYAQALETLYHPAGPKINTLNHLVTESLKILAECAKEWEDIEGINLRIAELAFDSDCRWVTVNGPEEFPEYFLHCYLNKGGRESNLGAALRELNRRLRCRSGWLGSMSLPYRPVIIFVTDGHATDDYEDALMEIRKNPWFGRAHKIGITLSDYANHEVLYAITENSKSVIKHTDTQSLEKFFRRLPSEYGITYDQSLRLEYYPDSPPGKGYDYMPIYNGDDWDDDDW